MTLPSTEIYTTASGTFTFIVPDVPDERTDEQKLRDEIRQASERIARAITSLETVIWIIGIALFFAIPLS